ncbi:MAG TPA: hypothetical protein VFF24_09840, partial [Acidimicrobiia bacterium]|nr:hypothetical protein [Acidimicrobiia bacterium]
MSDDLEAIPPDRSGEPGPGPESPPEAEPRARRQSVAVALGSGAAVLIAVVLLAGGSEPSSGSGRKADQEAS